MARSHASGIDLYRAAYPNGLFDGVYTTKGIAQRQVNDNNRYAERNPNSAWHQGYANGKVQKLGITGVKCNCYNSQIHIHEPELKWQDVE